MGAVAGGDGDVFGVGNDARTDILLFRANEAQLGDHVVLCHPWNCFDVGDSDEEGVAREAGDTGGGVVAGDSVFHLLHFDLVVFSAIREVEVGREGV